MTEKVYRSKCCNAEIRTDGVPDFLGSKEVCTINYVCLKCNKPCDVLEPQNRQVLSCYLAGSFVSWGQYSDWRDFVISKLQSVMKFYDPRVDTDQGSIATFVSQDLAGVESCDCIFYFVTKPQGDVGAAMECVHALDKRRLVILCVNQGLGFIHPFLLGVARRVLIGIDAGVSYLSLLAKYGLGDEYRAAYEMMRTSRKEG